MFSDYKMPSDFARENLYYCDGIGIKDNPDFYMKRKRFRNYLFMYVLSGTLFVNQAGLHTLKKDHFILMDLNAEHEYYSSKTDVATVYWMHFDIKKRSPLLEYIKSNTDLPYRSSNIFVGQKLYECICSARENNPLREYIYSNNIYACLSYISFQLNIKKEKRISDQKTIFINKVNEYIDLNITKKPDLEDFSLALGWSKYYFIKLFNKYLSTSPIKYYYVKKISHSKKHLLYSEKSIADIASELNFNSQSHFAKIFKDYAGISPLAYRRAKTEYDYK